MSTRTGDGSPTCVLSWSARYVSGVARTALSEKCLLRTLEPSSLTVDEGRSRHCNTAHVANHWSSTDAGAPRNHDLAEQQPSRPRFLDHGALAGNGKGGI